MSDLLSPVDVPRMIIRTDIKRELSNKVRELIDSIEDLFEKYALSKLPIDEIEKLGKNNREIISEINEEESLGIDPGTYRELEQDYILRMSRFGMISEHTYSHGCFVGPSPLLRNLLRDKFWASHKTYVYE